MKQHHAGILMSIRTFLEEYRRGASAPKKPPFSRQDTDRDDDHLMGLRLSEFASCNAALRVHSAVLDEIVYLISNPRCLQLVDDEYVAYLPEELAFLIKYRVCPDAIRAVHAVKKSLGAILTRVERIDNLE